MIRRKFAMALWLVIALPMASAWAESPGAAARPVFTPEDRTIIDRNAALRRIVERDPRLLRRVLDAIEGADQGSDRSSEPLARSSIMTQQSPVPSRNPDLDHLERSSPEAAHDLFQLIKKASVDNKSKGQQR